MPAVYFDSSMSDAERRASLYAGTIFINSASQSSLAFAALAKQMLEEAFAPHDPRTIHKHLAPEEVAAVLGILKPRFVHHPESKNLIREMMRDHGVDIDKTYFDVPRLRSAYPSHFLSSGIAYAFHAHRDTWYSAPPCQINWWFPVYPIQAENAMAFYPHYFSNPVANNSDIYNYYEWNARSGDRCSTRQERHARTAETTRNPAGACDQLSAAPWRTDPIFRRTITRDRARTRPTWRDTA